MLRCVQKWLLAGLSLALAGCSPAALMEKMPTELGGMPADAPAAPAAQYQYPAVHDMPPPRPDTPLTDEQQLQLEKDLQAARDRLEGERQAGEAADAAEQADQTADKKAAAKRKKKAKPGKKPESAGAASNP
jgi:hypothetical protein